MSGVGPDFRAQLVAGPESRCHNRGLGRISSHLRRRGPRVAAVAIAAVFLAACATDGGVAPRGPSATPADSAAQPPHEPGHASSTTTPTTISGAPQTPTAPSGAALLKALPLAPERPRLGYDRSLFPHWSDLDRDGCDTREEVLISESLTPAQVDPFGCRVVAGDWLSPYDGRRTSLPRDLDVDHVVALAEAWDSGAGGWDTTRRQAFANDLENPVSLIAVTSAVNRSKGDQDPAEWRPPRREAWCSFATDWATVKTRWGLSADAAEVRALEVLLKACPGPG